MHTIHRYSFLNVVAIAIQDTASWKMPQASSASIRDSEPISKL